MDMIEIPLCPNCNRPMAKDEVYRAGYDVGNYRTIPARIGRGEYCDHVKRSAALNTEGE